MDALQRAYECGKELARAWGEDARRSANEPGGWTGPPPSEWQIEDLDLDYAEDYGVEIADEGQRRALEAGFAHEARDEDERRTIEVEVAAILDGEDATLTAWLDSTGNILVRHGERLVALLSREGRGALVIGWIEPNVRGVYDACDPIRRALTSEILRLVAEGS